MSNELLLSKIGPLPASESAGRATADRLAKSGPSFDRLLGDQLASPQKEALRLVDSSQSLKFSAHAMSRLKERSIPMGSELVSKLEKAVDSAANKGAKESLILTSDAAFIVSVKNKTVITVVDRNQVAGNVFTNIDSTVVI